MVFIKLVEKPFVDFSGIGREEFMADIRAIFSTEDAMMIEDAYNLSKYGHRNQEREGGRRYFDHPKQVAITLYKEFGVRDRDLIIAALLHDIIEDTFILSFWAIERLFGKRVVQIISLLSKLPKAGYNQRMVEFGDCGVWLVKLGDNLHNTRTLETCSLQKRVRKIKETKTLYFPLIDLVHNEMPELADKIQKLFDEAITYTEQLPEE